MKFPFLTFILLAFCFSSCQEDPKIRVLEQVKEAKKQEIIFNNIDKAWNFNTQPVNPTASALLSSWSEWRAFLSELGQKPKSSIGAFQKKAKTLSVKALQLNDNIPIAYNLPEVKSRIAAITTKINTINLYLHLNQIPVEKIAKLIQETNVEVVAMQFQLDEINRKNNIKMEDGENDMLKMLDTTRAIPSNDLNIKPYK
ncbi:hypothetical protein WFZ85_06480 [Flavobacterium sp. j3]|uniref:Lipoprotein n=1 Tax=Flavobacterium aureirubrum TaxID=3133147 RepID=A0ABU9N6T1_9FLAO